MEATDHLKEKNRGDESLELTKQEAKEQLLYENPGLNGVYFEVEKHPDWEVGDGVVSIKVDSFEQDHYIYHEER